MSFKEKIRNAYSAITGGKAPKTEENAQNASPTVGFLTSDDIYDETITEEERILSTLDPEITDYIKKNSAKDGASSKLLPPRVVPVNFLTDTPTASQVLALLGMIRWCMENGKGDGKAHEIRLTVSNRGDSPFLVGMGDKAIPAVPVTAEYRIGS